MNNNSNRNYLHMGMWILGTVWVAKMAWVAIEWIVPLPTHQLPYHKSDTKHSLYYRYRLASNTQLKAPTKPKPQKSIKKATDLSGYKLVGIYSQGKRAVVALIRGNKTIIMSSDSAKDNINGYRLVYATATSAVFQNGDKKIVLKLSIKDSKTDTYKINKEFNPRKKVKEQKKAEPQIVDDGETKFIDRNLIQEYSLNPSKIWKNIGLYEVKKNGKLNGFKVRFIRKGSPFEKLGLKRGDIIRAINGEPIVDYATPMRMLRSADAIDDLSITIERNQEEQELKYEVK